MQVNCDDEDNDTQSLSCESLLQSSTATHAPIHPPGAPVWAQPPSSAYFHYNKQCGATRLDLYCTRDSHNPFYAAGSLSTYSQRAWLQNSMFHPLSTTDTPQNSHLCPNPIESTVGTFPEGNDTPRTPTHEIGHTLPIYETSVGDLALWVNDRSHADNQCGSCRVTNTPSNTYAASSIPDAPDHSFEQHVPQHIRSTQASQCVLENPFFHPGSVPGRVNSAPPPITTARRMARSLHLSVAVQQARGGGEVSASPRWPHGCPRDNSSGSPSSSSSLGYSTVRVQDSFENHPDGSKGQVDGPVQRLMQRTTCTAEPPVSTPLARPREAPHQRDRSTAPQACMHAHHDGTCTPVDSVFARLLSGKKARRSFAGCLLRPNMNESHAEEQLETSDRENQHPPAPASLTAHRACMAPQGSRAEEARDSNPQEGVRNALEMRLYAMGKQPHCRTDPSSSLSSRSMSAARGRVPAANTSWKKVAKWRMHAFWERLRGCSTAPIQQQYTPDRTQLLQELSAVHNYGLHPQSASMHSSAGPLLSGITFQNSLG